MSGRKCGHPHSKRAVRPVAGGYAIECMLCDAWLPLGPSNDEPEAVRVEMRAAELAIDVSELTEWCMYVRGSGYGNGVAKGWSNAETNMKPHASDWLAGYLAREIAEG